MIRFSVFTDERKWMFRELTCPGPNNGDGRIWTQVRQMSRPSPFIIQQYAFRFIEDPRTAGKGLRDHPTPMFCRGETETQMWREEPKSRCDLVAELGLPLPTHYAMSPFWKWILKWIEKSQVPFLILPMCRLRTSWVLFSPSWEFPLPSTVPSFSGSLRPGTQHGSCIILPHLPAIVPLEQLPPQANWSVQWRARTMTNGWARLINDSESGDSMVFPFRTTRE